MEWPDCRSYDWNLNTPDTGRMSVKTWDYRALRRPEPTLNMSRCTSEWARQKLKATTSLFGRSKGHVPFADGVRRPKRTTAQKNIMSGLVLQGQSITEPCCFHWEHLSEQSSCTNKLEESQPAPRRKTKRRNQLKPCSPEWQETPITGELDIETWAEIKDFFGTCKPQNRGERVCEVMLRKDVEGMWADFFKTHRRPLF